MGGPDYRVKRKRRRKGKTDYYARLKMLGKTRAVIRKSLRQIIIHFSIAKIVGDKTLSFTSSIELMNYGWKYNKANIPAAYLTGYLAGVKARKKKIIEKAIPDFGFQKNTKGNKLNAAVKGVSDAEIDIPHSESVIPSIERIKGKHIAKFARNLKKESSAKYENQFGGYLRKNTDPTDISNVFSKTLRKIANTHEEEPPSIVGD